MRKSRRCNLVLPAASLMLTALLCTPHAGFGQELAAAMDTTAIESLTGAKGSLDEKEGVFKVSVPRKDLSVNVAGVMMTPPMGLTSWAAFRRAGKDYMVMGDLVLLQNQVGPVMSSALDNGLEVTALHNHFIWDSPRIMFMHIGGMGPERELAIAVGHVFETIKETSGRPDQPDIGINPAQSSLDQAKLDSALHLNGVYKDGVYKFAVGRTTRMHDVIVGNQMGVNTWGAFAGSGAKAIVDGDFALHESELQNVLKILCKSDINVVAIHQHMIGEEPRIIFLHYWGVAPALMLAKALRRALDATHD